MKEDLVSTSDSQSTLNPKNILTNIEPLPGPSQQITISNEDLQNCLINIQSQMVLLSEFENSDSFINLISILNSKKATKEKFIEFLLALDRFSSETHNSILLPTRFFIEKILKYTRFLISHLHDCSEKLILNTENLVQVSFSEDLNVLQNKLQELKAEKKQLENNLHPDFSISRFNELTSDFEKLSIEKNRNFETEIIEQETQIEIYKSELENINKTNRFNKDELITYEQVEIKLKLKKTEFYNLQGDLYFLQQLENQIDSAEVDQSLLELFNIKKARLALITELEEYDPIALLRQEIEESNIDIGQLRTEEKILTALTQNTKKLNDITEYLKGISQLLPSNYKKFIDFLLDKINYILKLVSDNSILNILSDQEKLEEKIIKIEKLIKEYQIKCRNGKSDTVQALKLQLEMDTYLLNIINSKYPLIHQDLLKFLEENRSELKKNIIEYINLKQRAFSKIQNEKFNLELIVNKFSLINQIDQLQEKIHLIKKDQQIFKALNDQEVLKCLTHLEKLQNKMQASNTKMDKIEKQISEIKNNLTELQKQTDPSTTQSNKRKINILEKKKSQYYKEWNKLFKDHENQIELEKEYKGPIEKAKTRFINIEYNPIQLSQNERSLRYNSRETIRTVDAIEKFKKNALHNERNTENKIKKGNIEKQLFQIIQKSSNNSSTPESIVFNVLKAQLSNLKDQVKNSIWNTSGLSFFHKKVPDGIQKLRAIFTTNLFNNLESDVDDRQKLILLKLFSEVMYLINNKNLSFNFFRHEKVKNLYHSLHISLNTINAQFFLLQNSETEMNEYKQVTYTML